MGYIQAAKDKALSIYNVGDWIWDIEYKEAFQFDVSRDSWVIAYHTDRFRLATELEITEASKASQK